MLSMPRPPPPYTPPRAGVPTHRIAGFRVTDAEHAHLMATAKAKGLTFSDYMRSLVPGLADVVSVPQPTEEAAPTT